VEIESAETMADGCDVWLQWERACRAAGDDTESLKNDIKVLEADRGKFIGFIQIVARRK
jgi:hypothetical protein